MIQALGVRLRDDGTACRAYVRVRIEDITLNGVRIIERSDGSLFAQLPNMRDHTGAWFPAVELSPEVAEQVKAAAMEAYWRA